MNASTVSDFGDGGVNRSDGVFVNDVPYCTAATTLVH